MIRISDTAKKKMRLMTETVIGDDDYKTDDEEKRR